MNSLFFSFIISLLICYVLLQNSYVVSYRLHRSISSNKWTTATTTTATNSITTNKYQHKSNFHSNTCLFARYNGNTDRSNKPMKSSHGNSNNVKLQQREGSRFLNQPEQKAFDKYAEPKVIVQRVLDIKSKDRVPLSNLIPSEKYRGRIIAVKNFGLFVDIGSEKDGLVHVRDISKDYFITNHENKFLPGQDIDVWIKFIEPENSKLGLQMYPVQSNKNDNQADAATKRRVSNFAVGDEIEGTIIRLSQYGVYVDIGAEVEAYLHRRKMNIAKGQKSLQPWEITPLGSYIKGYVNTVDKDRKRIGLTTYRPDQWENKLPSRSNFVDLVDDDEELGGSSRADNLRALERELGSDDDGDFDENGDDEDGDDGYKFSTAEIDALVAQRNAKLLIDEVGDNRDDDIMAELGRQRNRNIEEDGEEISIDEIFDELRGSGNRDYITISQLRKWDYLSDLLEDGDLPDDDFKQLISESGARDGKMTLEQFEDFVDIMVDFLDLEDENEYDDDDDKDDDNDDDNDNDEIKVIEKSSKSDEPIVLFDEMSSSDKPPVKKTRDDDDNDVDDFDLGFGGTVLGDGPMKDSHKSDPDLNTGMQTNDILLYLYDSVAGKKGHVTLDDVLGNNNTSSSSSSSLLLLLLLSPSPSFSKTNTDTNITI